MGRRVIIFVLALQFAAPAWAQTYPDYNTSPTAAEAAGMPSTAAGLAARMRLGWNLGNSLEATGGESAWGNPPVARAPIAGLFDRRDAAVAGRDAFAALRRGAAVEQR